MTHREIVHKIVERNKGNLSFAEVNKVLTGIFKIINRLVKKGEEVSFYGLFSIYESDQTKVIKKNIERDNLIRKRTIGRAKIKKYRSWTKVSADEYCSKLVDEIILHNQTK